MVKEPHWHDGAEEYRAVQSMVRANRHQEALERAEAVLRQGRLSRRQAARMHSLICWVLTEELHQVSLVAVLHGEEAVRLASLLGDVWLKCEALTRLTSAYCRMGDVRRAREAVEAIARELELNEGALAGGTAALCVLRATVAAAEEKPEECLALLQQAETESDPSSREVKGRIRTQKLTIFLEHERYAEARAMLESMESRGENPAESLECEIARAWLALAEPKANKAEARRLATLALHRSFAAGRLDLARRFRRKLGDLLETNG